MTTAADRQAVGQRAGLCTDCQALQVLRSKRSIFVRCARSDDDGRFPRYPPLPVLHCAGYKSCAPVTQDPELQDG